MRAAPSPRVFASARAIRADASGAVAHLEVDDDERRAPARVDDRAHRRRLVAPGATTSTRASSASRYAATASSLVRSRRRFFLLARRPRAAAPTASAAARVFEGGGAIFSPHVGHFARSFLNLNAAPQFAHVSCSFLPIATDRSPAPRRASGPRSR